MSKGLTDEVAGLVQKLNYLQQIVNKEVTEEYLTGQEAWFRR
jgi:hypothetical protein